MIGEARQMDIKDTTTAFKLIFDDTMLDILIRHTNEIITEMASKYGDNALSCQFTNHVEVIEKKAFIGLLYLAGVFKSAHEDISSLWATDGTGRDLFRTTMTLKRFAFLLSALDESATRRNRIEDGDKVAAISELFNMMIINSQSNYCCGEYMTIDEMLVPFRGKCSFRVYIKSKPNKYGLKVQCLSDARIHYLYNAFITAAKAQIRTLESFLFQL